VREKRVMATRSKDLMQKVLIPAKWSNENCWIWLGGLHPQNGIPIYNDHKKLLNPRRILWHSYNPKEKMVRGRDVVIPFCGVRCCVNPYHLEKVSAKDFLNSNENFVEATAKRGKETREGFLAITHCPKGHEYNASNTGYDIKYRAWGKKISVEGFKCRYCKTCKAERAKEYRNRKGLGATRLERDYDKGGLLSLEVMDMEFKRPPRGF